MPIDAFVFNQDIPFSDLSRLHSSAPNPEVYVQGPMLIQYSRRQFLSDWYQSSSTHIQMEAEDPEFMNRPFTFLNTDFGHFMFAHFHRSLAAYKDKLLSLPMSWLIDCRGQSNQYLLTTLNLYSNLSILPDTDISNYVSILQSESNKNQLPGFFLSNNTDYDWRDYAYSESISSENIGKVIHSKKHEQLIIEWHQHVSFPTDIICCNPDRSTVNIHIDSEWISIIPRLWNQLHFHCLYTLG